MQQELNRVFKKMLSNTKTSKHMSSLVLQDLIDQYTKQKGKCYYTGRRMTITHEQGRYRPPDLISIDRVDSSIGYCKHNIVFCCWCINSMKSNLPLEKFKNLCELVVINPRFSDV